MVKETRLGQWIHALTQFFLQNLQIPHRPEQQIEHLKIALNANLFSLSWVCNLFEVAHVLAERIEFTFVRSRNTLFAVGNYELHGAPALQPL